MKWAYLLMPMCPDREKWKLWDKVDLKLKSLVSFHFICYKHQIKTQDTRQYCKWKMTVSGQLQTGNILLNFMSKFNERYFLKSNFLRYTSALKSNSWQKECAICTYFFELCVGCLFFNPKGVQLTFKDFYS